MDSELKLGGEPAADQNCQSTVLVVDDPAAGNQYLRGLVSNCGYPVSYASPASAQRTLLDHDFKFILLDFELPNLLALALLATIESNKLPTLAVVVSGGDSNLARTVALRMGAYCCLKRPITQKDLVEVFASATARQRSVEEVADENLLNPDGIATLSDSVSREVGASVPELQQGTSEENDRSSLKRSRKGRHRERSEKNLQLREIEKRAIVDALHLCEGNKARAARVLGITEKSIYNKIERLNIPEFFPRRNRSIANGRRPK